MAKRSPNSEVQEPRVITVSGRFLGDVCQGLTVHPSNTNFNTLGCMACMLGDLAIAMKGRDAAQQLVDQEQEEIDEITLGETS